MSGSNMKDKVDAEMARYRAIQEGTVLVMRQALTEER